jgi:predicted enzyme related to lactoylglutathione lyase
VLAAPAVLAALIAATSPTPAVAVGPQYDSTHVYIAPADLTRFTASFSATFGGTVSAPITLTITPTPSSTLFSSVQTPMGALSTFGCTTPVPYPFGAERTGYLVTDMDAAIAAARADGANVVVAPFPDPIGKDAVIEWPGGVCMQLYVHDTPPHAPPLATIPENRVYVSAFRADEFVADFLVFSHGSVVSDDAAAPGIEIGRAGETYRRVRIESAFGKMVVLVTDGHLPYPYGREITGYDVPDLSATLAKARAAGAAVLVAPYASQGRTAAIVQFPGGYVAEVHSH